MAIIEPETYTLNANRHAPNGPKPVLIYRDCLPLPLSESKAKEFFEAHAWHHGGTWGHIPRRHFHPNTHECYGILQGGSTLLLGCGRDDVEETGTQIEVSAGDVVVLPAGTGHCNLQSTIEFKYVGVYPEGAPKWRNEYGKSGDDFAVLQKEVAGVPLPAQDPVNGADGPLLHLWSSS